VLVLPRQHQDASPRKRQSLRDFVTDTEVSARDEYSLPASQVSSRTTLWAYGPYLAVKVRNVRLLVPRLPGEGVDCALRHVLDVLHRAHP
jgi:hypothetical protein